MLFVVAEMPRLRFPDNRGGADSLSVPAAATSDKSLGTTALDSALLDSTALDSAVLDSTAPDSTVLDTAAVPSDSSLVPSTLASLLADTVGMDSLSKAIWVRNRAVDDSLAADSVNRQRKNGIEAPVVYSAEDSMTYEASSGIARLYGESKVKYQDMDLESDQIYMILDSSLVHATGSLDSTGQKFGTPVFKMGSDTYENDTIAFNFKSKKGLIHDVYTQQEDGYMTAKTAKRIPSGEMFLQHGRYTTCDQAHPDFYFAMSRAKVRPGKNVVFGPTYLVVADVPLPFALPYGFFPFTKSYSSGLIMPTYGDDQSKGFYLRDGGWYFAISDKMDLKLTGEIFTKGSWAVTAASTYKRRYKYGGNFLFSYQNAVTGEKNMPDYSKTTSIKLQWTHTQDSKASPYSNLTASVNFASTSYEKNNLTSMYNPQALTQSTRTSSVTYNTGFSSLGMSITTGFGVTQNMRDSSLSMTLPDLTVTVSRFYPFRRKQMSGKERWYEKISLSYTGVMKNTIDTKENKLMHSSLTKDWRNGMQHTVPINANFTLFNFLSLNPSITVVDRMYTQKRMRSWDTDKQKEVVDTLQGFYNVYNWSANLEASTQLYGFYVPNRKIFGDKIQAVRHVFKPSLSFRYSPNFKTRRYGYYETYQKTDAKGNVSLVEYSPYEGQLYSVPGGKSGAVSLDISNNVEMKLQTDDDSIGFKKVSIIDELGANMSYDFAAKQHQWSDLTTRLRLKITKSYTFNMNATFATYAYDLDENGKPYVGNHTEYSRGRFGRFQGASQNLSYTLDNKKVANFFKWLRGEKVEKEDRPKQQFDTGRETNMDADLEAGQHGAERKESGMAETDEDGYMVFSIPWSLSIGYGVSIRENTSGSFNYSTMRYPYKVTQNLNFSGNIRISDGWNISFSSGYDFEAKKVSMTTASLQRDLHCFNMSCSVVLSPYTSYNFSFRCNAATLTDALKYDKRSNYSNTIKWY